MIMNGRIMQRLKNISNHITINFRIPSDQTPFMLFFNTSSFHRIRTFRTERTLNYNSHNFFKSIITNRSTTILHTFLARSTYRTANISANSYRSIINFRMVKRKRHIAPIAHGRQRIAGSRTDKPRTIKLNVFQHNTNITSIQVDRNGSLLNMKEVNGSFLVTNRNNIRRRLSGNLAINSGNFTTGGTTVDGNRCN